MNFWEQFWPQFVATIIGVGLGIPSGVWLNHLIESRTEKEKKSNILRLLGVELVENKSRLVTWRKNPRGDIDYSMLGSHLKYETWKAYSEGGELEWVKDPVMLNRLSNAYHLIKVVENYSERLYNLTTLEMSGNRIANVERMRASLDVKVDECIEQIDKVFELELE